MDEWIKNWWDIYTMEYYSAIKRGEILPFVPRINLEGIMLSEMSRTEKDIYFMISLKCGIFKKERQTDKPNS